MKKKNGNWAVKKSATGLGLFAQKDFKAGDFIIEYTGKKISHEKADKKGGLYLFTLNKKWVLDGTDRKHKARYLNHSCKPNCEAIIEDDKHIMIYAMKKISTGDELTFDYGEEYFEDLIKGKGCRCEKCQKK